MLQFIWLNIYTIYLITKRDNYAIWNYQNAVGVLNANDRLLPQHPFMRSFKYLIKKELQATYELVADARQQAANRKMK
jgi:hypothetical protein